MGMSSVLAEIIDTKRDEVAVLVPRRAELAAALADAAPVRDFLSALGGDQLSVIAEIKRRSPSKGDLAPDLDPATTARAYESGGASCLSVLTDGPYFGGSTADLVAARAFTTIPVLRKDFTVDALQIDEARVMGADAILLIVTALDDPQLRDLHDHAVGRGLTVLVEVHDDAELDRALAIGPRLIGVNARDLSSFAEDLSTGERMIDRDPARCRRRGGERDPGSGRRRAHGRGGVRRGTGRRGTRARRRSGRTRPHVLIGHDA